MPCGEQLAFDAIPCSCSEPPKPRLRRHAKTITLGKLNIQRRQMANSLVPDETRKMLEQLRPKTRADCANIPRPCPFALCRYHNYLEVNEVTGSIKIHNPDVPLHEMEESCALDVADRGAHTLQEVAAMFRVVRERVRQIESIALRKIRRAATDDMEDFSK
jgi:hypothetical protein